MPMIRFLAISSSALALAACAAVGPNYRPPPVSPAAQAQFVGAGLEGVTPTPIADDWWRLYQDPALDGLVAEALAANKNLAVAAANIAAARASLRGVRSDRLPITGVSGGAQYGRAGGAERAPGQGSDLLLSTGFDVAYEVDLFGRIRRNIEAADADLGAVTAARDAVRIIVAAETTRAYGDILATARRLEVARRTVTLIEESVRLADKRFQAGRTSRLDLVRVSASAISSAPESPTSRPISTPPASALPRSPVAPPMSAPRSAPRASC